VERVKKVIPKKQERPYNVGKKEWHKRREKVEETDLDARGGGIVKDVIGPRGLTSAAEPKGQSHTGKEEDISLSQKPIGKENRGVGGKGGGA